VHILWWSSSQKQIWIFFKNTFRSTFIHSTHLSTSGRSNMVFEHLQDLFDPKDLINNFSYLFMIWFYVVVRCILVSIVKALDATNMLALAKPSHGIWPIVVGKVLYGWWTWPFVSNFVMHFQCICAPHQFGVLLIEIVRQWCIISRQL